jgi:hypothetical protein
MSKGSIRTTRVLVATGWLLAAGSLQAEIYKTVDENGNVVYTDRAPAEGAKAMDLPGLSIIEMIRSEPKDTPAPVADDQDAVTSIRELRRGYRDFSISQPVAEETYWGTGGEVALAWDTRYRLQPGMTVTFYVDGVAQEPTTAEAITVSRLDRGAHTVYAELMDARHRKIATADSVTFYIQQYSIHYGPNRQGGPGPG